MKLPVEALRFPKGGMVFPFPHRKGFAQKSGWTRDPRPPESGGQRVPKGRARGGSRGNSLKMAASEPPPRTIAENAIVLPSSLRRASGFRTRTFCAKPSARGWWPRTVLAPPYFC